MQQSRTNGLMTAGSDAVGDDVVEKTGANRKWPVGQLRGEMALDIWSMEHGDCEPAKVTGVVTDHRRIDEGCVRGVTDLSETTYQS